MIAGVPRTQMTEREYRKLDALSQSMIKDFAKDRKKFQQKYILGEEVKDEESPAMLMGNLVDCMKFTPADFENRYCMGACTSKPTEKMLVFVNTLFEETVKCLDEQGEITRPFVDLATIARERAEYKISLEQILKSFVGKEPEVYYRDLLHSIGKTVISQKERETAEKIVEALDRSPFTGPIFNPTDEAIEEIYQYPILDFTILEMECKGLLDKFEINHREEYIQPWDLKVTWSVEGFYKEYYLGKKGYIQAGVYDIGCKVFRDANYPNYEVRPMKFVVADSANYYAPLIYELSAQDIVDALKGFTHRGYPYKGVFQLVSEIKWHQTMDIWDMSMENFLNEGRVNLSTLKV